MLEFTFGELFNLFNFKGEDYFTLLYSLSKNTKIILLIILLKHKIQLKILSVLLALLLWIIFAHITKLKDYKANKFEYVIIFIISLLFCLLMNSYNFFRYD